MCEETRSRPLEGNEMIPRRKVSLRSLKRLAAEELPPSSPLRETILADADEIDPESFLPKLDVWITLLNMEGKRK